MTQPRDLGWCYLGRVEYRVANRLQERVRQELGDRLSGEHLLLLEHPHVYTLGRRAAAADILASGPWLRAQGIEVAECDRGGQVTYHGPGQLVGYPVLDLSPDRRDVRRYVADLQRVLIDTLADFGVAARPASEPSLIGVWVGETKIASIGVHLRRWITTHGFALNVTTDLGYFQRIVPCGIPGVRMASIESETGARPDLAAVAAVLSDHFARVFGRRLHRVDAGSLLALEADTAPTTVAGTVAGDRE
jgi:lipoyl(octanoyl) transferase